MIESRTIESMEVRSARRDLALVAVTVVGLSRLLEPPLVWLVAGLLLGAMLLGTLQVLSDDAGPAEAWAGVPVEALILPSVAAIACLGSIRLIPFGLWLVPALAATFLIVGRTLALESRIHRSIGALSADDLTAIQVTTLLVAFLAFTGVAAMVPGGLIGDSTSEAPGSSYLAVLIAGDAILAALLGYRVAALRVITAREALWSALTYGAAIAIAAATLRAMEIPRLVGPALLTLVFYLWDAFAGAAPARRRDPRWLGRLGVLVILGVVVAAWNLLPRG